MEMVWDVERALKVNANAYHVYIACILAKLMEKGVLEFGVLKEVTEDTGRCMAQYISAHGLSFNNAQEALLFLNDIMGFTDEVKAVPRGDVLEVRLNREACRICPRNVGGLELPGPACPNIGFIKGYLEGLGLLKLKEKYSMEKGEMPLKQENGQCIITYQVLEKRAEVTKNTSKSGFSLREALAKNCSQISSFLGMGPAEIELLHRALQGVPEKSGVIVGEILGELFRDPESARILQEAGLTREDLEDMLKSWLAVAFQGDYGERMCLEVSRIGMTLAGSGLPPAFVLTMLTTVTEVISRHVPAGLLFPVVVKALRWNLMVAMLGYDAVRQRLFEKFLGINEGVYKRLQAVTLKDILKELGGK
jgi:hypothetical protein